MSEISLNKVHKITVAFSRINQKTNKLFDCSSDDFSLLSSRFMQSHSNITALRQNALSIKNMIDQVYSSDTLENIKCLLDQNKKIESNIESLHLGMQHQSFQFVFNEDVFYLQLHNLIQDLTTLQLLIATIRLGNQENIETDFLLCDRQINRFIESIRTFYLRCQEVKQSHQLLKINEDIDLLDEKDVIDAPLSLIEQRLLERRSLLLEQVESVDAADKTSGKSLSEVITNLQFEDIIRQKVEHITAIQDGMLRELTDFNASTIQNEDSLHTLARIRGISELQVAQLVHTSKDYQLAIQGIIDQFSNIAQSIQQFTALGNSLLTSPRHTFIYRIIESSLQQNFRFDELSQQANFYDKAAQGFKHIFTLFNSFAIIVDAFGEDLEKTSSVIQANSVSQQQKKLLQDIISGVQLKMNNISQSHALFANQYIQIIHQYEPNNETPHFSQQLELMRGVYFDFKKKITSWETDLMNSIKDNKSLVKLMQKELTIGVKKIKFYNQFDKLIKSIITEFDGIHKLVAFTDSIEVSEEIMAQFKSLYTMQSEHIVHDHVQNNGDTDELMVQYDSSLELF